MIQLVIIVFYMFWKSNIESFHVSDVQAEVKALKNWIIDMDERLQPLSFKRRWSKTEIETIANEYKVRFTYTYDKNVQK